MKSDLFWVTSPLVDNEEDLCITFSKHNEEKTKKKLYSFSDIDYTDTNCERIFTKHYR